MLTVIQQVLSSVTEAEVGATFYGCKDAVPLRNMLADLGHVQGATRIIRDNEFCEGILNNAVKQIRSKAMDVQFYWVKFRIAQYHRDVCFHVFESSPVGIRVECARLVAQSSFVCQCVRVESCWRL